MPSNDGRASSGSFQGQCRVSDANISIALLLIVRLSQELLPLTTILLMDQFASHVLRALFVLLTPSISDAEIVTSSSKSSVLRSKKSAKHRAKQGPMKSVLSTHQDGEYGFRPHLGIDEADSVPPQFDEMSRLFIKTVRETLDPNEIRALAADKVACPVLVVRFLCTHQV